MDNAEDQIPQRRVPFGSSWAATGIRLAVLMVTHWFTVHVAFGVGTSAHIPVEWKAWLGLREALFLDWHTGESLILCLLGMLFLPVLFGVEYLAAAVTRKAQGSAELGPAKVSWRRIFNRDTHIWIVYWPVWTFLSAVAPAWDVFVAGVFVAPPLLAAFLGFRLARPARA